MIYTIAFKTHIYISTFTLLAGLLTVVFSILGVLNRRTYTRLDKWFSISFSIGLYLQLVLGFMIYFVLRTRLEGPVFDVPDSANDASLRFWAIEHIALMIFALFLTQIGRIYIRRTHAVIRKFKASLFYHGMSLFLILFSLSIALFFR